MKTDQGYRHTKRNVTEWCLGRQLEPMGENSSRSRPPNQGAQGKNQSTGKGNSAKEKKISVGGFSIEATRQTEERCPYLTVENGVLHVNGDPAPLNSPSGFHLVDDDTGVHKIDLRWVDFAQYAAMGAEEIEIEISNIIVVTVDGRWHTESPWDGAAIFNALAREGWSWDNASSSWTTSL